jgi:hypothetical protein
MVIFIRFLCIPCSCVDVIQSFRRGSFALPIAQQMSCWVLTMVNNEVCWPAKAAMGMFSACVYEYVCVRGWTSSCMHVPLCLLYAGGMPTTIPISLVHVPIPEDCGEEKASMREDAARFSDLCHQAMQHQVGYYYSTLGSVCVSVQ